MNPGLFLRTLLPALLWAGAASLHADLVVLKDGREYSGTLLRAEPDAVVILRNGAEERHARADIVHIRLQREREWDACRTVAEIPDPELPRRLQERPALAAAHPAASAITLFSRTVVRLRTPQTWSVETRSLQWMRKEDGEHVTVGEQAWRRDAETFTVLHAVTIRPDGSVLHLDDNAVQDEAPYADLPQYDNTAVQRFAFPDGKPGNVFDAATRLVREKPLPFQFFHGEFLFGSRDPVAAVRLEILVPPGCELRSQVLNDPRQLVAATTESTPEGTWYRWERTGAPMLLPEPLPPPAEDLIPRVVVSSFPGTWDEAAAVAGKALEEAAASAAALPPPPAKTAPAIWAYVSRNVNAVNVPLAATGFRPGDAGTMLALRRGAALDRCHLLYRWLKAAGVDAEWVWLRRRTDGHPAPRVPSLSAFGEPAVRLTWNGRPVVVTPGDDMEGFLENALANAGGSVLGRGGLDTAPAPADAPVPGADQHVALELAPNGDAAVRERLTLRGERARELRAWRRLTAQEIRNQVERRVRAMDARAADIRFQVEGDVRENEGALCLLLDYRIPEFADVRDGLASARLPWLAFSAAQAGRSTRTFPLFWEQPAADSITITVTPPPGFRLRAGLDDVTLAAPPVQLQVSRSAEKGGGTAFAIRYSRQLLEAPAADYPAFKATLEKRAQLGRQFWLWTRDAAPRGGGA